MNPDFTEKQVQSFSYCLNVMKKKKKMKPTS